MGDFFRVLIRISAFLRKEIVQVLRQPRLVLTLIAGPFLILALFGIGYRNVPQALRTVFVVPEDSGLSREQVEQYAANLGPQLIYQGLVSDQESALRLLRAGQLDLVVVVPSHAIETIRSNQQAVFTLFHNEIDPFQIEYVKVFGQVYIDEINRRVLANITGRGQSEAAEVDKSLEEARANAAALRQAMESNDAATARMHKGNLDNNVNALTLALGASAGLLGGVQQVLGAESQSPDEDALANLADVQKDVDALNEVENEGDLSGQANKVGEVEQKLDKLDSQLSEFQSISPEVLVTPFRSEVQSISPRQPNVFDYFSASVIVLLLQHIAITFAALSIVQERGIGTVELFRVSPLSAFEALIGKYVSYILFNGALAAILTLLLIYGLGVPILGGWLYYSLVILGVIIASLGFGFIISLLAENDTQAVQYSMIVLLAAVFFSGLFMALEQLWEPIRVISWLLPATYGAQLLRNVMLRGYLGSPLLLVVLFGMGAILFGMAWLLLRRLMKPR
jgi:ABC-2 type transport system permease protein